MLEVPSFKIMYVCSACGTEFDRAEARQGQTDTPFDIFCPACNAGVIPDGDAEEVRRQRDVQKQILTELQELADETRTPGYEGPQYPLTRLQDDLERLLAEIETELQRRDE